MKRTSRSTPAGQHRPVLLDEVLAILDPQPGGVMVDCTTGWAGHATPLLERLGPEGLLIGMDLDADNLPVARERLAGVGPPDAEQGLIGLVGGGPAGAVVVQDRRPRRPTGR